MDRECYMMKRNGSGSELLELRVEDAVLVEK